MANETAGRASLRHLTAAPHRLLFFVGATNVLLAMAWWTAWLASLQWPTWNMPRPHIHAGWLHAFVMQYQMLPSFIFGFLLTVFPKWMTLPELQRSRYVSVGLGLLGGQVITLIGALGWDPGVVVGWGLTCFGWLACLVALVPQLWNEPGTTWHARSCVGALCFGLMGLASFGAYLAGESALWLFASIKIGTFGLLLPLYLTVAHRMFPFFASNVVVGYSAWRPNWLIAVIWILSLAHLWLELAHGYAWLWAVDILLSALTAYMCWRWWPRPEDQQSVPPLLTILFIALLWLPLAFFLYSGQSVWLLLTGSFEMGRAPAHALFVGFFGSVLVAMVTRVTQGHSGRPLVLPGVAAIAFVAIQIVAIVRIAAEFMPRSSGQLLAAVGWLLALGPWVLWAGFTYLTPRADRRSG